MPGGNRLRSNMGGRTSNGRFSASPQRGRSPARGQSPSLAVGFADRSMYDRASIIREREDLAVKNAIENVLNELDPESTKSDYDLIEKLIQKVTAKENGWQTIEEDYREIVTRIFTNLDKVKNIKVADFNDAYYRFVLELRDEIEQIKDQIEQTKNSQAQIQLKLE